MEIQLALKGWVGLVPEDKWEKDIPGRENSMGKGKEAGTRAWCIQRRVTSLLACMVVLLGYGGLKSLTDEAGLERERIMMGRKLDRILWQWGATGGYLSGE